MTGIIIQARMSSTRFYGKVMKPLSGKEVLWHIIERCKKSKLADRVIVATSVDLSDDIIYDYCKKNTIEVFRGNLLNVLQRYYECAKTYNLDNIVRVTADCPLVDPAIIDGSIKLFLDNKVDYVSNSLERIFPRGLDCEIFSFSALGNAFNNAKNKEEKEHVTPYIIKNCSTLAYKVKSRYEGNFRLTLDEEDDYTLLKFIYKKFYKDGKIIDVAHVITFLKNNPRVANINAHVRQKS